MAGRRFGSCSMPDLPAWKAGPKRSPGTLIGFGATGQTAPKSVSGLRSKYQPVLTFWWWI